MFNAGGVLDGPDMRIDQISEDGIRRLVDAFYDKVRADAISLRSSIAQSPAIGLSHLATMRDFWSSVMLTSGRYKGNPVAAHLRIEGMEPQLFDRWLELFDQTCGELFDDNVADAFRAKAIRIAESLKLALFYRPDRLAEELIVTFVVTDNCIKCKYMDCVEVCPVDCFYEGENMLVIHPDECIDCGVCEPECPAEAILPDTRSGLESWLKLNADFALVWPNITIKRDPPADAKEFDGVPGKFDQYFSPNPGQGD